MNCCVEIKVRDHIYTTTDQRLVHLIHPPYFPLPSPPLVLSLILWFVSGSAWREQQLTGALRHPLHSLSSWTTTGRHNPAVHHLL